MALPNSLMSFTKPARGWERRPEIMNLKPARGLPPFLALLAGLAGTAERRRRAVSSHRSGFSAARRERTLLFFTITVVFFLARLFAAFLAVFGHVHVSDSVLGYRRSAATPFAGCNELTEELVSVLHSRIKTVHAAHTSSVTSGTPPSRHLTTLELLPAHAAPQPTRGSLWPDRQPRPQW